MKRLLLGGIAVIVKVVAGVSLLSAAAVAAPTGAGAFNHLATGFPLTGAHAVVVCETCHVGGVFKGTPRNCDGCHAPGKRVVATPKSNSHIVTDAPCESCHFNAATFLGARYNHGSARPGDCATCHNGRLALGRPANHSSNYLRANETCDRCHRTSAFVPASWNHIGVVPGSCEQSGCHVNGSNQYYRPTATHTRTGMRTYSCDDCHGFIGWIPAKFKHNHPGACSSCHNGNDALGAPTGHSTPKQYTKYSKITYQCDECHNSVGWSPAAFKHNVAGTCDGCHTMKVNHIATNNASCSTCHKTRSGGWLPASFHSGNEAGICGTCHDGTIAKGKNGIPLHIPTTGVNCDLCHTSMTSFASWTMNHSGITTCNACHDTRSPAYPGIRTRKTIGSHENSKAGQDCVNCHNQGISWNN